MSKWKHPYKKLKRAIERKTSNQRHLPVLVFEKELILSQKQARATKSAKSNERQMETRPKNQNEQQKTTKSIFHSHFHSFSSTLDLWMVVDIKSKENQKEQQWAMKSNEKHQKATMSNKKQKWTSELEKPKRAIKKKTKQKEQLKAQKVQMETRLKHEE